MTLPSSPFKLPKEEYEHLQPLYRAIADIAVKHGKAEITEGDPDAQR